MTFIVPVIVPLFEAILVPIINIKVLEVKYVIVSIVSIVLYCAFSTHPMENRLKIPKVDKNLGSLQDTSIRGLEHE